MLLLDTHALLWLVRDDPMTQQALDAVDTAQGAGTLYASAITAWELGVAISSARTGRSWAWQRARGSGGRCG